MCLFLQYNMMRVTDPAEIEIIRKETFNNWYKLRTYYLATIITSTPVHVSLQSFGFLKKPIHTYILIFSHIYFIFSDHLLDGVYNDRISDDRSARGNGSIC